MDDATGTRGTNRRWLLAARPEGRPSEDCFELEEREVPSPGRGEVLVRTLYLSVDPYMRGRMRAGESYAGPWGVGEPLRAGVVGEVVESRSPEWEAGDVVSGQGLWADFAVVDGDRLTRVDPDLAPVSTALGVLGMPGRTAYFGLLDVGEPTPGDTVLVSAAAGAVGSVVGQLARRTGCDVIGVAGSDEKVAWLTDELGFDAGINYERESVADAVGAAAADLPGDGVDVYFDNVGGEITDAAFEHLATGARVVVCGQIALYNATGQPTGPRKLSRLITTRARVEGFLVGDYADRYREANRRLARWVEDGSLQYRETVTEGLESAPDAFVGLFDGVNVGKQLVKVGERGE
jgi:NADPH-dependent curcumin reductase CurA